MDDAYEEVTLSIKIPYIFSSRLPHTLEESAVIISTSDLSFVQNISEGDKMEMAYVFAYNMFRVASILSLISARRGDFLAPCSPFKENDTRKGNTRAIELKCVNFQ